MPAQVFGELRSDKATYGEKLVLKKLQANLPKEFSIYVECPLHGERLERYPDFIVLTNYGVVVLEVKDWIQVERVTKHSAQIRTGGNETRSEKSPVATARDYAILLSQSLQEEIKAAFPGEKRHIPWGWAAVLPRIHNSTKTQLWKAWGEDFIWNAEDLSPNLVLKRLKRTISADHIHTLQKDELQLVKSVIYPVIRIEQPDRPVVILDEEQEKIVAGAVNEPVQPPVRSEPVDIQMNFLDTESEKETLPAMLDDTLITEEEKLVSNTNIRLIRGVAGSGKSLVLVQRAKYLSALYPEWNILVLAFNDMLSKDLQSRLTGFSKIKTSTFHSLCLNMLRGVVQMPQNIQDSAEGWLRAIKKDDGIKNPILDELSVQFLTDELNWIKELGIQKREEYLSVMRKGRGDERKLSSRMRNQIYDLLEVYNEQLHAQHNCDWADVAVITYRAIQKGMIELPSYDAIFIDEAQDFAPIWLKIVRKWLKNDSLLFMADDPAQSIYRYYSWKERGISVVGRTRRLNKPYRNTYEIYRAAYSIIEHDEDLQKELEEEGQIVAPKLDNDTMTHGERPLVERFDNLDTEVEAVRSRIQGLLQEGVPASQIAVFTRRKEILESKLKGTDVRICTYKEPKGMEFHTVFLMQVQEMFSEEDHNPKRKSVERRLIYMAMTRARRGLYLGYRGKLPESLMCLSDYADMI